MPRLLMMIRSSAVYKYARISSNIFKLNQPFFGELFLEMREFLRTTRKPNSRAVNGNLRRHQSQKKKKKKTKNKIVRIMWIMIFDMKGIIPSKFLSQGQMINKKFHKEILWHIYRSVLEKRRELGGTNFHCFTISMHLFATA